MLDFNVATKREKELEVKYQGVIGYVEAKQFLEKTGYTAAKIRGALTRYCKANGLNRPKSFVEMEEFLPDFTDWWLDADSEYHKYGELKLHEAVSNYLAFVDVWKAKSKSLNIYTPSLMKQVGIMLVVKNTFAQTVKIGYSYAKRNPALSPDAIKEGFLQGFTALLPHIQGIETGQIELSEKFKFDDLTRLIGAYMAGDANAIGVAETLKHIEHKEAS